MDQAAPFTLLLLGQPTLRRRLRLGAFAALDQRYTISDLDQAETASYIAHHLKLAGRTDTLFSDDATQLIHQVSRGLPRQVNNLATQSLVAAFAAGKAIVDESEARRRREHVRLARSDTQAHTLKHGLRTGRNGPAQDSSGGLEKHQPPRGGSLS